MNHQETKSVKTGDVDEKLDRLVYDVIGAAIEVHRALGPGYAEAVYEEALCIELEFRRIPFTRQKSLDLVYRNKKIGETRLDLLVGESLIVELKAVDALAPIHTAQILSYLKLAGCRLGLIINFNVPLLKDGIKRVISSSSSAS